MSCFVFLEPVLFTIVGKKFFFLHSCSNNQLSCGILRKIFKMRAGDYERIINHDWPNNKLIGLLIISWGRLLLSQEHIKENRKRIPWVRPWIRKRDSEGAYYSIINDLRLTDKENFWKKISEKPLAAIPILLFCLNKNYYKIICFHFFLYCTNGHCLSKSSLQLMLLSLLRHAIQKTKEHILHPFDLIHYTEIIFFWVNMWSFYMF